MKRIIALSVSILFTVMMCTSCGMLGASSSTATAASTVADASVNGQNAGAALRALYTQYKSDGNKLNMSNLTNLMNVATLANNIQGLKGQSDKTAFYKDFASGLVTGSKQLVTQQISGSVMNGLSDLVNNVDLTKVQNAAATAQQKGTAAVENAAVIANSVTSILNLFK